MTGTSIRVPRLAEPLSKRHPVIRRPHEPCNEEHQDGWRMPEPHLAGLHQSICCNLAVPPDAEVSAQPFRVELYDGPSH